MNKNKLCKIAVKSLKILLFEIIFIGITGPILAFYGPFQRIKYVLVGSSIQSSSHQYIARLFLSDKEIEKILKQNAVQANTREVSTSKFNNNGKVEVQEISSNKHFSGYAILVHDPKRIKVGSSLDFNMTSMSINSMASRYNAVAAINGSGYNVVGKKEIEGYIVQNGKIKVKNVKSNSEKRQAFLITKEGKLLVGSFSIDDIRKMDIIEGLCFGPALIVDGKNVSFNGDGGFGIAQRTAIGQKNDGTIIMLAINGRKGYSLGASIKDIQEVMNEFGAVNAFNLDGGSSTHIYYNKRSLNLDDAFGSRPIPTIVYVK